MLTQLCVSNGESRAGWRWILAGLSAAFDSMFDMNTQVDGLAGNPVLDALDAAGAAVADVQRGPVYGLVDADLETAIEQAHVLAARVFDATLSLVREADDRDLGRRLG